MATVASVDLFTRSTIILRRSEPSLDHEGTVARRVAVGLVPAARDSAGFSYLQCIHIQRSFCFQFCSHQSKSVPLQHPSVPGQRVAGYELRCVLRGYVRAAVPGRNTSSVE